MKNILHYTAGHFAKLNNMSKRNLLYYDEIGLFSPDNVGDNGYRYYSINQFEKLQLIIALRELKVPIEEIKKYLKNVNVGSFQKLLQEKMDSVDKQILRLQNIKNFLVEKDNQINLQNTLDLNEISVVNCKAQFLSVFADLADINEESYEILYRQLNNSGYTSIYTAQFCARTKFENEFEYVEDNATIFLKCDSGESSTDKMEEGKYLRGFCTTGWDNLKDTYQKMFDYGKNFGLQLARCSYEEDMNEFYSEYYGDYVTQVLIKIIN